MIKSDKHKPVLAMSLALLFVLVIFYLLSLRSKPSELKPTMSFSPSSSEVSNVSSVTLNQKRTVVWGKVTDTKGTPTTDILVSIANQSATTDKDGNYIMALSDDLTQGQIQFINLTTGEQYERADSFEQFIYLSPGKNIHQDFVIEKRTQIRKP